MRGKGHIPDPVGHCLTSFDHASKPIGASAIPDSVDLRPFAPQVMNQLNTSSCTGHAVSEAIATSLAKAGRPLVFVPSPKGIYDIGRCIDRVNRSIPLTDAGAMPNQIMRGINEYGVRPIQAPTSDNRYSDCEVATINNEPKLNDIKQDATSIVLGQYSIGSTYSQRVTDICLALANGYAVTCSVSAENATWQNWVPANGPLGAQSPIALDHYVWIIGYRTVSGKRIFRIRNSWDVNWGDNGEIEVTEDFIAQIGDIYALSVKVAA